ncbi:MAG: hypothetical protein MMC33_009997 [Icmadophila ericetorum]|nr:hypothetical protein [Icmadophila ericetorum]
MSSSLILLTSILGASTNWLVIQFLHEALFISTATSFEYNGPTGSPRQKKKVALVSFLRDWDFWAEGMRKMGANLTQFVGKGEFAFVDGLSGLFGAVGTASKDTNCTVLRDAKIQSIERSLLAVVKSITKSPPGSEDVVLIVDGLDFFLAATDTNTESVLDMIRELRENVHTLLISASADAPLIQSTTTPLEVNHTALVTSLAYQSKFVICLRLLDTGIAKDISGVMRITKGPESDDDLEEKEVLYFVAGDGGVKVFPRGA